MMRRTDQQRLFAFLNRLSPAEHDNLRYHLATGVRFSVPDDPMPESGYGCLNVLYQTRVLEPSEWKRRRGEFRKRVCQLVGVRYDPENRPTSPRYLGQLKLIRKLTESGEMTELLVAYYQEKDSRNADQR